MSNLPPGVTDNDIENFLCVYCVRCGVLIAEDVAEEWEETCPDCLELDDYIFGEEL